MDEDFLLFDLKSDASSYSDARHKLVLEAKFNGLDVEIWDSRSYDGWIAVWAEARQAGPEDSVYDLLDDIAGDAGIEWDMTPEAESAVKKMSVTATTYRELETEAESNNSWYKDMIEESTNLTDTATGFIIARDGEAVQDPDEDDVEWLVSRAVEEDDYDEDPFIMFTEDGPSEIEDFITVHADRTMTASDGTKIASLDEAKKWLVSKLAASTAWYEVSYEDGAKKLTRTDAAPDSAPMVELRDDGSIDGLTIGAEYLFSLSGLDSFASDLQEARRQIESALS